MRETVQSILGLTIIGDGHAGGESAAFPTSATCEFRRVVMIFVAHIAVTRESSSVIEGQDLISIEHRIAEKVESSGLIVDGTFWIRAFEALGAANYQWRLIALMHRGDDTPSEQGEEPEDTVERVRRVINAEEPFMVVALEVWQQLSELGLEYGADLSEDEEKEEGSWLFSVEVTEASRDDV
jgi:hypothetical protein